MIYGAYLWFMRAWGPKRYFAVERNLMHIKIFYSLHW